MKDASTIYRKNKDFVARQIDNDMILMPIYKTNNDINEMYTLNESAACMWNLIDGKKTKAKILDELSSQYDVSQEKLQKDFDEFIKDMKQIQAVV